MNAISESINGDQNCDDLSSDSDVYASMEQLSELDKDNRGSKGKHGLV